MLRTKFIFILSALVLIAACNKDSGTPVVEPPIITNVNHNPIIKHIFTADPGALVHGDSVYIYTGHDEQVYNGNGYVMNDWHVFSSNDLENWIDHGAVLEVSEFSWAKGDAWASQCIERDGKFYWYICAEHRTIAGKAIGVAMSDSPTGPFTDPVGAALVTNNMTTATNIFWDDIDPTVFIDDDGQAYMFWGNTVCYYAKLKDNMIELDGPIHQVQGLQRFTEAPYLHKKEGTYYLTYSEGWPEKTAYATADSLTGVWEYKGVINEAIENCGTNHQAIIEFENQPYFIYHTAGLPTGGDYRRSVCIDSMFYNTDGTIQSINRTRTGVKSIR